MEPETYRLSELADAAGVTPRTVRYYIAQGLLRSPGRLGANTRYGREHLDRLQLIRRLRDQELSLADIRDRLEPPASPTPMLADAGWAPMEPRLAMLRTTHQPPMAASPLGNRSTWQRIGLTAGVELHVRRNSTSQAQIERLVAAADQVLRTGESGA